MRLIKYEISRAIDKLKSIVQKNDKIAALSGILVEDGYLIASNTEITMQVKLEACAGDNFIIPMKAFELIKNLPEGEEVEITANDKNVVTIKMSKIKNSYQSFPPEDYVYKKRNVETANAIRLPGAKLMEALSHCSYAAADGTVSNLMLKGIYFEGGDGCLNLVASNGHVMAWDRIEVEGTSDMKIIVPKVAVKKLLSMGIASDIDVSYDTKSVILQNEEFTIFSRLLDGTYFNYKGMFRDTLINTAIERTDFIAAMSRANMCINESKKVVFNFNGATLHIAANDTTAQYEENVPLLKNVTTPLRIGFDPKLVLDSVKSFKDDVVNLNLSTDQSPLFIETEKKDSMSLVLPVKLR